MPGTTTTKSVVTNEPGGRKRDEIFVDVIEKISVTFNSSVSILIIFFYGFFTMSVIMSSFPFPYIYCCKILKHFDEFVVGNRDLYLLVR